MNLDGNMSEAGARGPAGKAGSETLAIGRDLELSETHFYSNFNTHTLYMGLPRWKRGLNTTWLLLRVCRLHS